MQETRALGGRMCQIKPSGEDGVQTLNVTALGPFNGGNQVCQFHAFDALANQQFAQRLAVGAYPDLRYSVDEKSRLEAVLRRVLVDLQKARQRINQVVEGGTQIE